MTKDPTLPMLVRYVPVSHVESVSHDQMTLGVAKVIEVVAGVWWPGAITFVAGTATTGGFAGWQINADNAATADAVASDVALLTTSLCSWLGLGPVSSSMPWPELPPVSHQVAARPLPSDRQVVALNGPMWAAALATGEAWALSVSVVGTFISSDGDAAGTPPEPEVPPRLREAQVVAEVRLYGAGSRRELMAALLSAAGSAGTELVAYPHRADSPDMLTEFGAVDLGHMMIGLFTRADVFPERPVVDADEIMRALDGSATPHVLVLGASGQGKSSLLGNIVDGAIRLGEPVLVTDNADGQLADQVVASAAARGQVLVEVDFGAEGARASTLVTAPPEGTDAAEWAETLYEIVRDILWAGAPSEYFGPVAERCLRLVLAALVRDPLGPRALTDAPLLLDPVDGDFRTELLTRIADPVLTHGFAREILPMLTSKDPGNSLVWLVSKLDPLIGSSVVRRALSGQPVSFDLEAAITDGSSIVIKAPATVLGDSGSRIVIAILVHRAWLALRRRASATPRFTVVLDEWQRYSSPTITAMLAEGRKSGVRVVLANQNLAQLSATARDTALSNVGTLACFRTGPADAYFLREIFRTVTAVQLQTLPRHHLAVATEMIEIVGKAPAPLPLAVMTPAAPLPGPRPGPTAKPSAGRRKTRPHDRGVVADRAQPDG